MRAKRVLMYAGLMAAAALLESDARAGNGTVPAPTGTIYYQDLSTLDPADGSVMLYAMDADGGNRTAVLRTDRYVRPSRLLHGPGDAARWFLTMRTIEGQEIGGNPRRDVFAVRADGAELCVTSDPAMEYWMPEWTSIEFVNQGNDFAVVSMLARRWTSDAADATVVEGTAGMHLSYLSFAGTPYVRGFRDFSSGPATTPDPILWGRFYDASVEDRSSAAYFASTGGPTPDVASYAWGGQNSYDSLVVQDLDAQNPRVRLCTFNGVVDVGGILATSLEDQTLLRLAGRDPQVSYRTDHFVLSRLARAEGVGTDTWVIEHYNPPGGVFYGPGAVPYTEASVAAPVNASTTRSLSKPFFSPDGYGEYGQLYVAYQLQLKATGTTNYIERVLGGLGAKPLTPGVKRAATGEGGMVLVAWR